VISFRVGAFIVFVLEVLVPFFVCSFCIKLTLVIDTVATIFTHSCGSKSIAILLFSSTLTVNSHVASVASRVINQTYTSRNVIALS